MDATLKSDMRSWLVHSAWAVGKVLLATLFGDPMGGVKLAIGFWMGHEIGQHVVDGTGPGRWLDRIMDAVLPSVAAVAVGFTILALGVI